MNELTEKRLSVRYISTALSWSPANIHTYIHTLAVRLIIGPKQWQNKSGTGWVPTNTNFTAT